MSFEVMYPEHLIRKESLVNSKERKEASDTDKTK